SVSYQRDGDTDVFHVQQNFAKPQLLRLRLVARRDRVASVLVDGLPAPWHVIENSVGVPRIDVLATPRAQHGVVIVWAGAPIRGKAAKANFERTERGQMRWWMAPSMSATLYDRDVARFVPSPMRCESVDLSAGFNDRVTQIFKNEYRSPR